MRDTIYPTPLSRVDLRGEGSEEALAWLRRWGGDAELGIRLAYETVLRRCEADVASQVDCDMELRLESYVTEALEQERGCSYRNRRLKNRARTPLRAWLLAHGADPEDCNGTAEIYRTVKRR